MQKSHILFVKLAYQSAYAPPLQGVQAIPPTLQLTYIHIFLPCSSLHPATTDILYRIIRNILHLWQSHQPVTHRQEIVATKSGQIHLSEIQLYRSALITKTVNGRTSQLKPHTGIIGIACILNSGGHQIACIRHIHRVFRTGIHIVGYRALTRDFWHGTP